MPTDQLTEQATTNVVRYSVTDAEIAAIREKCQALSASTPKGYEDVRVAIGTLRDTRVAVEKRRVELKADALAWSRKVDSEAKRITDLITAIEEPLKVQKSAIDDERARVKAEKEAAELRGIQEKIEADRAAEDAKRRAALEAEEAASRVAREAEAARLTEERARLDEERRQFEAERQRLADERRAADERARSQREAEESRLKAERDALAEQQRVLKAEQDRLASEEAARIAKLKADEEAAAKAERERQTEVARLERIEAMRPDVEKLRAFAASILALPRPKLQSAAAEPLLSAAVAALARVATDLENALTKAAA